jgi:Flp pilus assembly protein TadD
MMLLASIQENLKEFDAARQTYEKLLATYPKFFPATNRLASVYLDLGQLDKAYDLATEVRRLLPEDGLAADTLGWVQFKKGDYGKAADLLRLSADKLPDDPEIQFRLGMSCYMLGQNEPARVALQKAANAKQAFPDQNVAQQRLSILAVDPSSTDPGLRSFLEAQLRERSDDPQVRMRLAELQEQDGSLTQAVENYQLILDHYPDFALAARRFALLYGKITIDTEKMYIVAMNARRAYPDDAELAKVVGVLECGRKNYQQCADQLQRAAKVHEDDPELLYELGMAYSQLKRLDEAKMTLERVITLNAPTKFTDEARQALAACCQAVRDGTRAPD